MSHTYDVDPRAPDDVVVVYIDSVSYHLPPSTAKAWAREFQDTLDGRESRADVGTPDVENDPAKGGDEYVISVGGDHAEYGDGWHIQTARFPRSQLESFVAELRAAEVDA